MAVVLVRQALSQRHAVGLDQQSLGGEVREPAIGQQLVYETLEHFVELPALADRRVGEVDL